MKKLLTCLCAILVVFGMTSMAFSDTLEVTEVLVTDFGNATDFETTPTLGQDSTSEILVYNWQEYSDETGYGPGEIMYQRLKPDGTTNGPAVNITNTPDYDDILNDISGSLIVYSAFVSTTSTQGKIMLYNIETDTTTELMSEEGTIREARIHGNIVAWTQGTAGGTRIYYLDLNWPAGISPVVLAGPTPPAMNVEVGEQYVVWDVDIGAYHEVWAYEIATALTHEIASDPILDQRQSTTFGDWIVWEAYDGIYSNIEAYNRATDDRRTIIDNDSICRLPSIYDDLIAWESNVSGDYDVWLYRISDGTTYQVTDHPYDQLLNNVYGYKVAYVDLRDGDLDVYVSTFEIIPDDPCADLGGDADEDGVCQDVDNCPEHPNPSQVDVDNDGVGDICDNCRLTQNSSQADTDLDNVGDACDNCPLVSNNNQNDADIDGIGDVCDNCASASNPDQSDVDSDTVGDACDNCPDDSNTDQADLDTDTVGDACDNCLSIYNKGQEDVDIDGVGDACDNCINVSNTNQKDDDGDTVGNVCDNCDRISNADQADADSDTVGDACDNCLSIYNKDQEDVDTDGVGDVCDNCDSIPNADQVDKDSDTVGDICDNCPETANPDQEDGDEDDFGEVCDCNDADPNINPEEEEICDGLAVDEDCDGLIDDADPDCDPTCTDNDEDGYFVEGGACGLVDCDDEDENVNPGMAEIPGNDIDDDCKPGTPGWGTPASVINAEYKESSDIANCLFLLFVPIGAVLLWKGLRRRK